MNEKLLHTPEGVRDIYNSECEKKLLLEYKMHQVLKRYGFKDIETPTFEFFDIFNKERGTIASKEMYKFFDREGNTLVLRPDITPSIARCVARYYKDEEFPIRLCYTQNTFINNSSYQGKLKETTQLGAELINDNSVEGDAEMIALTISCLLEVGLKDFQVEIGQADFFKGLVEEGNFNAEEVEQLRILIENKNLFGLESIIAKKEITQELKEVLLKLPELFGDMNYLKDAKSMTTNQRALQAIERLERLYEILVSYGYGKYVTFDLGMLSKYNYYTGIIFRAYTYGTGDAIADGGRYDNLVGQFGKEASAIGVAIITNQLMLALSRQKIEIPLNESNTLIIYDQDYSFIAIQLANQFRGGDMNIELLKKDSKIEINDYIQYGKRNGTGGILYINNNATIQVIHLETGDINEVSITEIG